MSGTMDIDKAMEVLAATSRTFFIPISHLTPGLQEAVATAYLCMRAIDEIEDHPSLPPQEKIMLLRSIARILQEGYSETELLDLLHPYQSILPEVSLHLGDWVKLSPPPVIPNILQSTATMAEGMAEWVEKQWQIESEEDLDSYTFYVAGLVGLMLSDLWMWYDQTETDRTLAVAFGRGLQAVNILRNHEEDLSRGVNFYPRGWGFDEMYSYAKRNLEAADLYTQSLKPGPIFNFCKIPLVLAHGTLNALGSGAQKLTRTEVIELVKGVTGE